MIYAVVDGILRSGHVERGCLSRDGQQEAFPKQTDCCNTSRNGGDIERTRTVVNGLSWKPRPAQPA